MKAIVLKQPGNVEQLEIRDIPKPKPKVDEVLVKVKAAAVNRTDLVSREGTMGDLSNVVLGVEVSGVVEEVGENVDISIGTKVMGLVNRGGYAEYVVMPKAFIMEMPRGITFEQAAAIPEVFLTAYQTLFYISKLQDNESILIHAGASGVGTAAIQLAKNLKHNIKVITTAGSAGKLQFVKSLGSDCLINYKKEDFDKAVLNYTKNQGVNVILDFIGASYWNKNINSIAIDGRWVLIGFLGGSKVENMNLLDFMQKRIQFTGTLLTPRTDAYKAKLSSDFQKDAIKLFENKTIKPIVDSVFNLSEIQEAHTYMESNKNIGKIILKV